MQNARSPLPDADPWRPEEFHKSSFSPSEGQCFEIGFRSDVAGVRDSKTPFSAPIMQLGPDAWSAFRSLVCEGKITG